MTVRTSIIISILFIAVRSTWAGTESVTTQPSSAPDARTLHSWQFNEITGWNDWMPNSEIRNVHTSGAGVQFHATGADPILTGPRFGPLQVTNRQWLEIDLESDMPGSGELFYTNTSEGPYHGFQQSWSTRVVIPDKGPQTVVVWPFWGSLKQIIQLRFDPPSGMTCSLKAVRIMEAETVARAPHWYHTDVHVRWNPLHAVRIEKQPDGFLMSANTSDAVVFMPVEPFAAAERSMLKLDIAGDLPFVTFAWTSDAHAGLIGEPIVLKGLLSHSFPLDLRLFPNWKGTITGVAIGFGVQKGDSLKLRSLVIDKNDPSRPLLRLRSARYDRPLVRACEKSKLLIDVEHVAGPPTQSFETLVMDEAFDLWTALTIPRFRRGERKTITTQPARLPCGKKAASILVLVPPFDAPLHIEPALPTPPPREDYDVPRPRPVKTDYELGVYYFPGWGGENGRNRWSKQAGFPERDSLLGWYQEGLPEVADWHIKWAVENGLTFFLYDWYWRNDREELGEALNDGFLHARYNHLLKFAVMWANHRPFSDHTPQQLLQVTDYWIEHYLRRPNYWRYDGKPYVNFYDPEELIRCLGSPEKVKTALDQMRERARTAGLPGLHIAACVHHPQRMESFARCGFDSITAYTYPTAGAFLDQSPYRAFILAHPAIWERTETLSPMPYIPLLTMNWDARPWHGPATKRRYLRSTADFAEGLRLLKSHLDKTGKRVALFEAWNEWGEGAYLEPNCEFGFGDLEAIREVFVKPGDWPQNLWPGDVGLAGKYDIRAGTQPSPE